VARSPDAMLAPDRRGCHLNRRSTR
jgi:hypothetical protein